MINSDPYDTYILDWQGPFVLQGSHEHLLFTSPAAAQSGIYIFTIEYQRGYLIYFAGLTARPFKTRFRAHLRAYRKGIYTILDTQCLPEGKRVEIWHGMWAKKATNTPEMKELFLSRHRDICPAIENLLSAYRIFLAPIKAEQRILARIEAAIMNILYSSEEPFSSLPDKGMFLAPRWKNEQPVVVKSISNAHLHALPQYFEA